MKPFLLQHSSLHASQNTWHLRSKSLQLVPWLLLILSPVPVLGQVNLPQLSPPNPEPITPLPFKNPSSSPLDIQPQSPLPIPEVQGQRIIRLNRVLFRGNKTLPQATLDQIASPYLGKSLSLQQILDIRTAIADAYSRQGYTLSTALITIADNPTINPSDATIIVRCVEAQIENVNIHGTKRLRGWIRRQLKPAIHPAIHEEKLAQILYYLQEQPSLRDIRATLSASAEPGLYNLSVKVDPATPLIGQTVTSNDGTPSTGSVRQTFNFTALSPLGRGDAWDLSYQFSDGATTWQSQYEVPFNAQGGKIGISWLSGETTILRPPFDPLDIVSTQQTYEFFVIQPLLRQISDRYRQEVGIGFSLAHTAVQGKLLGTAFPLIAGADENGRARTTVLSVSQTYADVRLRQGFAIRSSFKFGLPIAATLNPHSPDGEFIGWFGQFGVIEAKLSPSARCHGSELERRILSAS